MIPGSSLPMPTSKEFRHDIQEYSSLLRALKTAATENLSEHIFYAQERDLEVDHEGLADTLDVTHPLARPDKESWTRWPLMTSEINPPQWTFEEEVGAIAERALKADAEQTDASGLVDLVSPPDVSALTSATAFALTRMLALAAANFPLVDRHSQSRVKPSTWTEILELTEIENIFPIELVAPFIAPRHIVITIQGREACFRAYGTSVPIR